MEELSIPTNVQIAVICEEIKSLLLEKNMKYGDSALNPVRVFSNASPVEQLLVRIDDKLNRIKQGAGLLATDEDVVNDLIGYLVLLKIAMGRYKTTWMEYEEFLENYTIELQILDAIDQLGTDYLDAAQTVDHWVSHSNTEKTAE